MTPAGEITHQVCEQEKVERLYEVQALLKEQQLSFNQKTVNTTQPVLLDREGKVSGQLLEKTPYMQSVPLEISKELLGSLVNVLIKDAYANSLTGSIVDLNQSQK